jgi:iron complex transport system ATP-binding protein
MNGLAVQIRSLRVRAGRRNILSVEHLDIERGEVVVVLGPNGAGKSTLVKSLLGFVRPQEGESRVLGLSLWPRAEVPPTLLRRRIGYVPQVLAGHSETPLTVREVVAIGRTGIAGLFRRLTRKDWQIVDEWLERLGLAELKLRAYASLSGGEQRKTLIAKAMVQQPEMLVLDEPTANLDLFWRERIVATLERLYAQNGLTIILVCHELEVLPPCSRRVLVLRAGELIADGPPQTVLTSRLVESLYGTGLRLVSAEGRYAVAPRGGASHD